MMAVQDIMSLLPMLILAGGVLLTMILIAAKRNHILTLASTLIFLAASFASIFFIKPGQPHGIGDIFLIDHFGLYYQALILATTFVIAVFSYICLESFFPEKRKEEFYLLLMLATLGSAMMVVSTHFISFFVSLETLTISLYTLISYYKQRTKAIEAGLKYLILAAMSSSFLLFGMALIYAVSGEMSFIGLSALLPAMSGVPLIMLLAGIGMMIVGIGFKLAVVPFHIWAPDVYEGASAPATAFIATVSKGSIVALLLRFFMMANLYQYGKIMLAFTIISILSMLIGNLLALVQNNVKRILAYSSIAHFGYLLVAFIAGKGMGTQAATFYLTTYTVTILGAFGMITIIPQSDDEATDIENYKGLFWRRPFLAAFFTVFLLSLAGIPLTAGFIGKYFLLTAGLGKEQWGLAFVLIISSVIGLFYYLRLIISMMQQEIETKRIIRLSDFSIAGGLILGTLALLVVCIGIWPDWLLDLINKLS
jgi:NADH-quinone oxidoreductase subunit N